MADEIEKREERKQKTKVVGYIDLVKLEAMKEWTAYKKASAEFAKAKTASETAKDAMREALKNHMPKLKSLLNDPEKLDFTEEPKRIRLFENLEGKGGTRAPDLSNDSR
jgi:predicted mannosyl-3-phosphoglycerate phosphatase (HAD superfamily)